MKQVERETIKMEETRKQPSKLEGPGGAPLGEVIGAVITVGDVRFLVWNWSRFGLPLRQ